MTSFGVDAARRRCSSRALAVAVAACVLSTSETPATASTLPQGLTGAWPVALLAKRARTRMTPEQAEVRRAEAQGRATPKLVGGDYRGAGRALDVAAAEVGDPVLYLAAGEAYLEGARAEDDPELARAAIERAAIALDVLHFHLHPAADPRFRLVSNPEIPALLERAEALRDASEACIAEIEEAPTEAAVAPPPPRDPTRALTISGSVLTVAGASGVVVGVVGLVLGVVHQSRADDPAVYGKTYDRVAADGRRDNLLAYAFLPAGGALLATGVALLVVARKRAAKRAERAPELSFTPSLGAAHLGATLHGRF